MKDINRLKEQINIKIWKKIEGEIKELLKSFKIIIPEEEIKYCEVIILDEQPDYLYVQVRNHNDQTTYESYISNYAELLEETRNDFEFINVKKSDNCGNEEKDLYSRKNNNLIRKRLVFPSFLSNYKYRFRISWWEL